MTDKFHVVCSGKAKMGVAAPDAAQVFNVVQAEMNHPAGETDIGIRDAVEELRHFFVDEPEIESLIEVYLQAAVQMDEHNGA